MNSRNVELNFSEINLSSLQFVSIPGTLPHEGTIIIECPPNDEIVVFLTLPFLNCPMDVCLLSHPIVIHLYPDNKFSTSCSINNSGNSSPGQDTGQRTVSENISGIDIEMQFDQFLSLQPTPMATTYSRVHVGYGTDGPCWSGL